MIELALIVLMAVVVMVAAAMIAPIMALAWLVGAVLAIVPHVVRTWAGYDPGCECWSCRRERL